MLSAIDRDRGLDALHARRLEGALHARPLEDAHPRHQAPAAAHAGPDCARLVDRFYRDARAAAADLGYGVDVTHELPVYPFLRPDQFRPGTFSVRFTSGEVQLSRFLVFLETKLSARPAALVRLLGLTFHPDLALVQLTWKPAPAFVRLSPLVASTPQPKRQAEAEPGRKRHAETEPEDAPPPKRGQQEGAPSQAEAAPASTSDLAPLLLPPDLLKQAAAMADAVHDAFGLAETDDATMLRPDHTTLVFVVPAPPVVSYEEWVECARQAQAVVAEAVLYFEPGTKRVCVRWSIG